MVGRRELIGAALAAGMLSAARAFAQPAGPVVSKIALVGPRVLMAAKIGANGPYFFAIDTGGVVSLIDIALAKKLGMEKTTGVQLVGVGGRLDDGWFRAGDVTLGNGTRLPNMVFAGRNSGFGFGEDVVGLFGAGLFTTFDSDLDFTKSELRLWTGGRPDRTGWTQVKSRFTGRGHQVNRIYADAAIDGYAGEFLVDTGAPGQDSLDGPAAKASGLWGGDRPYAPAQARGVGRGIQSRRIVRAGKLRIGKFAFEKPLVSLSAPGSGANSDHDGVLGMGTLSRLNLSSDVKARTLWVQPSGIAPVAGLGYPFSGILLNEQDGRVVVVDVGTGSPAAAAGVMAGDVVPGVPLAAAFRTITGPAGREVTLNTERGGAAREVKFTLADYL